MKHRQAANWRSLNASMDAVRIPRRSLRVWLIERLGGIDKPSVAPPFGVDYPPALSANAATCAAILHPARPRCRTVADAFGNVRHERIEEHS